MRRSGRVSRLSPETDFAKYPAVLTPESKTKRSFSILSVWRRSGAWTSRTNGRDTSDGDEAGNAGTGIGLRVHTGALRAAAPGRPATVGARLHGGAPQHTGQEDGAAPGGVRVGLVHGSPVPAPVHQRQPLGVGARPRRAHPVGPAAHRAPCLDHRPGRGPQAGRPVLRRAPPLRAPGRPHPQLPGRRGRLPVHGHRGRTRRLASAAARPVVQRPGAAPHGPASPRAPSPVPQRRRPSTWSRACRRADSSPRCRWSRTSTGTRTPGRSCAR